MDILALQFAPLLVELLHEGGLCCPPLIVGGLSPVFQECFLKQAIGILLCHEVVHLVVVGDRDPMIFALNLEPVQLARTGDDVQLWSVTLRHEEVGLDGQLLLGGN